MTEKILNGGKKNPDSGNLANKLDYQFGQIYRGWDELNRDQFGGNFFFIVFYFLIEQFIILFYPVLDFLILKDLMQLRKTTLSWLVRVRVSLP